MNAARSQARTASLVVRIAALIGCFANARAAPSLSITTEACPARLPLGGSVILRVVLHNDDDANDLAVSYTYPNSFVLTVEGGADGGSTVPWFPQNCLREERRLSIPAGGCADECLVLVAAFSLHGTEDIFRRPGTHTLRCRLDLPSGESVEGEKCRLEITRVAAPSLWSTKYPALTGQHRAACAVLLAFGFGPASAQRIEAMAGDEVLGALENGRDADPVTAYLSDNLLKKIYFYRLLAECTRERTTGPRVSRTRWYRKFSTCKVRADAEYLPLMARERRLFEAHTLLLLADRPAARTAFEELSAQGHEDYVAKRARSTLSALKQLGRQRVPVR